MFDIKHPPFLVVPAEMNHVNDFPESAGYRHHPFSKDKMLLSYGEGWTFPISVKKKELLSEPPLMLVRNVGGVTSESSTARSGYAHQFVSDEGGEPECLYRRNIFGGGPEDEWMLVPGTVDAVWLQFSSKYQFLGEGSDSIEYQYGKMIILRLEIETDAAPSMDRKADIPEMRDIQYRVCDRQVCSTSWSMADNSTLEFLSKMLSERSLDGYYGAVKTALLRAGFSEGAQA